MKAKDGFILRDIGGQPVVVSVGAASETFNGMIKLNASGKILWEKLQSGVTEEELVETLMDKYNVTEEDATRDVKSFLKTLSGKGIIE